MRIPVREPGRPIRYRYADLPEHLTITRWRPLAGFPGPLPAPARIEGDVAWQSPVEPPAPPEQTDPLDWPGEYSSPPNISLREAESTDRAHGDRTAAARPGGYRDSVAILIRNTVGKLEAEFVDQTHIAAAGYCLDAEPAGPERLSRSHGYGVSIPVRARAREGTSWTPICATALPLPPTFGRHVRAHARVRDPHVARNADGHGPDHPTAHLPIAECRSCPRHGATAERFLCRPNHKQNFAMRLLALHYPRKVPPLLGAAGELLGPAHPLGLCDDAARLWVPTLQC